jgi:D-tyrosyl-tRNA(Tyr) deacylase
MYCLSLYYPVQNLPEHHPGCSPQPKIVTAQKDLKMSGFQTQICYFTGLMKVLIQRVRRASVSIDNKIAGKIGTGFVVLLGARTGDTSADTLKMAQKTCALRIFPDHNNRMNLSIKDINGEILVISQFTLYADTRKGNRPSFIRAGNPDDARKLYQEYIDALKRELGSTRIQTGSFGADMLVEISNDGPVTIELTTDI